MLASVTGLYYVIMKLYTGDEVTKEPNYTRYVADFGPQSHGKSTLYYYLLTEIIQSEMNLIHGQLIGICCQDEISRGRLAIHTCCRTRYTHHHHHH